MKSRKTMLNCLAAAAFFLAGCTEAELKKIPDSSADIKVNGTMDAELTAPPLVPAPVGDREAKKLIVKMEIIEKEGVMADGVSYLYWTFGGSVPGSFIRSRVGDEVEFTLSNHPDNKLPHNIDLHAVTGPGGGANSSFVAPGQNKIFSFKLLNPGLYVYHCATAPVGMHIANGMYGLILVEPEGGLPKADKEYYIMQGDFYTQGEHGEPGFQNFSMKKAVKEEADYVVFNGSVGALIGENALTAKVGETVRLFVGNGGPNLVSSFHVVGEIFDNVYSEGGSLSNKNVQTTSIPVGGTAIVEFKVDVPGKFLLVDHAIFRALNKGALAMLKVSGEERPQIYSGLIQQGIYNPEGGVLHEIPNYRPAETDRTPQTLEEKIASGKQVYGQACQACHQAEGEGIAGIFPPLANSDYMNSNVQRTIDIVLNGKIGEMEVNGAKYNNIMTKQILTDRQVIDVLTYIYSSWGNNKTEITQEMLQEVHNQHLRTPFFSKTHIK